ncbi:unnamed protein product [Lymnaea stagnalis]|uniref:Carboxylesterase type B domain-containing protein n=1 Tax=Lymnaea stagnalis TaxID=6523 RepID=A0AAV2HKR8_LYMST
MAVDHVRIFLVSCNVLALVVGHVAHEWGEAPLWETTEGPVRGFTTTTNEKKVDVFYGIPFAKPPIGDLRYRQPEPIVRRGYTLNATKLPNSCIQINDEFFGDFSGATMWNANTPTSEDCLYLNVWVPRTNPPYKDKAVMVWIYGGAFYSGSSTLDIYMAHHLAVENDVIVVSIQYRVGTLGFLTLETSEAPGNAGLGDQRMALEWISKNIEKVGGSPENVTIMGESAGAVSVGLLLLCNTCRNYFQKAILQSGSPQAKWGALPKHTLVLRSRLLASFLGCSKDGDDGYVARCMRTKNATDFLKKEQTISTGMVQFPFVPTVDGVLISRDPKESLDHDLFPQIPILIGSNENEATYFMLYFAEWFRMNTSSPISKTLYPEIVAQMFDYYPYFPESMSKIGKDAIAFHYRDWVNPDDEILLRKSLDRAISDFYFVCPVNYFAKAFARKNLPVYYYWFNHRWSASPWPEWAGVLHADEIWFTFGHPMNGSLSFTEAEKKLSRDMMRYWTNFAKTGNPNKSPGQDPVNEWPLFREHEQAYLNLTIASTSPGYPWGFAPRAQDCAFWDIYLPQLLTQTRNITDAETEWKMQFNEWKTKYIVDWKTQFDSFLHNYQRRMGSCSGGKP